VRILEDEPSGIFVTGNSLRRGDHDYPIQSGTNKIGGSVASCLNFLRERRIRGTSR
jgi:hypothetical protein